MRRFSYAALIMIFAAGPVCKKAPAPEREGVVNFLAGTVMIIDGAEKKAASVGDPVKKGMRIETGGKSFVDIYFDDSEVRVLENSSVDIDDLGIDVHEGTEHSLLKLNRGSIFSRVMKKLSKDERFVIRTPTTTAGVRGTEFMVISEELKSLVACLNGTVQVKNDASPSQEPVLLRDEQQVVVEKDRPMSVGELASENRRLMNGIRRSFREMKTSLRERFEKKRDEIRKAVEDRRQKDIESVEKQKTLDRENVEKQKLRDKENVDRLRTAPDKAGTEAGGNVEAQKEEARKNLENVKPAIKKFKSNVE
jgi:hypothetical protein